MVTDAPMGMRTCHPGASVIAVRLAFIGIIELA